MVITQGRRVAIRTAHHPVGSRGLCAICHQQLPCDAIQLLNELESVEAQAREHFHETSQLRRRNGEMEALMRRAIHEPQHGDKGAVVMAAVDTDNVILLSIVAAVSAFLGYQLRSLVGRIRRRRQARRRWHR
jgi:hypothetical protein